MKNPQMIKEARIAAGLKQRECAEIFGYSLRGWQQKEQSGSNSRGMAIGEWYYLLLLAGTHPQYMLIKK